MTSSTIQLENLTLSELTILLGHLRLGEAHLKKRLNAQQFHNLLRLGSLNLEQEINVSSNWAEKSGNVALVLNTVITSVFGAWMGFSGFMSLHLNSFIILAGITAIALFVGIAVSYFSFRLTEQNAQASIYNQKLHNLQLHVLTLVIAKQNDSLASTINYLNHALKYIKEWSLTKRKALPEPEDTGLAFTFDTKDNYDEWAKQLSKAIHTKVSMVEKNRLYSFYSERLLKIIDDVYTLVVPNESTNNTNTSTYVANVSSDDENSFIKILAVPYNDSTNMPAHHSWLQKNVLPLIAGIIPTLLGGFASMFVFLAGGPNLAKELGLIALEHTLRHPTSRIIEFTVALTLTFYYGTSFVYNNYKLYVRQHEVIKTKKKLIISEKETVDLEKKLGKLIKMKRQMTRMINIFTAIERITESSSAVLTTE